MTDFPHTFTLCHSIPGRLRVKVTTIRRAAEMADVLAYWLVRQTGIQEARANPLTGSVILHYDPQTTSLQALFDLLDRTVSDLPQLLATTPRPCPKPLAELRSQEESSLSQGLAKVIGITGFLGVNLFRSVVLGASFGPLVLTGAAIMAALPLLSRAATDIWNHRFIGLNPLLATASLLAITMGEALTALEVIWILEGGELLEEYVADRSRRAIKEILQVSAKNTYILVDGVEVEIPVNQVQQGDTVVVHTMAKIPVDGVILEGEALVDQAPITGRSEPEFQKTGDLAFAGTIVQEGKLHLRAEKVGETTYLAQIVCLVEQSLANRPQAEKQVELLAARLTRLGMAVTVSTLLLTWDLSRVFAVTLVMACPCATILAASTAVTAALANAADQRILIKGGLYLERFGETDCFCFDKTGTLTTGLPKVTDVVPTSPAVGSDQIIALAAAAEAYNPHPLAKALVKTATDAGYRPDPETVSETFLGRGVRATVGQDLVVVGNHPFLVEEGVDTGAVRLQAAKLEATGHTVVYVAQNQEVLGIIALAAEVRQDLDLILGQLRRGGVRELHLISGDSPIVVQRLGESLGFDDYDDSLLPEDKARYVEDLTAQGYAVAVIGDGVNDAPALSKASVGLAMGAGGSEAAIAAADIALADDDLRRLIFLRGLSRQTVRVIHQNYWLAVATDLVGSLMAVVGRLTPVLGGLMHLGHAVAISVNSGRLLNWKPPRQAKINKPGASPERRTSKAGSESSAGEDTRNP